MPCLCSRNKTLVISGKSSAETYQTFLDLSYFAWFLYSFRNVLSRIVSLTILTIITILPSNFNILIFCITAKSFSMKPVVQTEGERVAEKF